MSRSGRTRSGAVAVLACVALAACMEREMTAPATAEPPEEPVATDTTVSASLYQPISCVVTVKTGAVDCAEPEAGAVPGELIIGGQGRFVHLATSNSFYNQATQQFTMNVTVRNLIGQALGTSDGVAASPYGVRVFFASGPMMMSGEGSVTLVNGDGAGAFTGVAQPYFLYNTLLQPFQASAPKTWVFSLPPTVTSYAFTAYVATVVQHPDGWVSVEPTPFPMQPPSSWKMSATVYNVVGELVPDAVVKWTISDTTRATIKTNGTVKAVRAGQVIITARSGKRSGTGLVTIMGTERIWAGSVSTDWHNQLNWAGAVLPEPVDSVVIPASAPLMPVLAANVQVGGVRVANNAMISIGPFDLTASADVSTGTTGGIVGTGRVLLTGSAHTVQGVLPRMRIFGRYTLTGNLTTRAPIQVDAGRLTSHSFRVQASSF